MTSSVVKNSVAIAHANACYAIFLTNPSWASATVEALQVLMDRKSVGDAQVPAGMLIGYQPDSLLSVFFSLGQLLAEVFRRFPKVIVTVPATVTLTERLVAHFDAFADDLASAEPTFRTEPLLSFDVQRRRFVTDGVKRSLELLPKILERAQVKPIVDALPGEVAGAGIPAGALTMLRALMQPPGEMREEGPRHDNDFADIRSIAILPTPDELTTQAEAFVPANISGAPYHLDGMEGRLDLLFRLMREDFVGPLRSAVQSLLVDFEHLEDRNNSLALLLDRGGGRYRPSSTGRGSDCSDLMVYRDVEIMSLDLDRHEMHLNLLLTLPRGFGTAKHVVRNLAQGHLVVLLSFETSRAGQIINVRDVQIHLGLVAQDLSGQMLSVNFFDAAERPIYLDTIRELADCKTKGRGRPRAPPRRLYLVELPGFLVGTVEPFLLALQQLSGPEMPFADILSAKPPAQGEKVPISAPLYARNPGFEFDLTDMLVGEDLAPHSLVFKATVAESVENARRVLGEVGRSKLDPTQAQALVDCLTREVALVEGPPGTGKSFLGTELVRVLDKANVGKILM